MGGGVGGGMEQRQSVGHLTTQPLEACCRSCNSMLLAAIRYTIAATAVAKKQWLVDASFSNPSRLPNS